MTTSVSSVSNFSSRAAAMLADYRADGKTNPEILAKSQWYIADYTMRIDALKNTTTVNKYTKLISEMTVCREIWKSLADLVESSPDDKHSDTCTDNRRYHV